VLQTVVKIKLKPVFRTAYQKAEQKSPLFFLIIRFYPLKDSKNLLTYEYTQEVDSGNSDISYNDFWYGEANIDDVEGLPIEYDETLEKGNFSMFLNDRN
jgi:hypothetical protein